MSYQREQRRGGSKCAVCHQSTDGRDVCDDCKLLLQNGERLLRSDDYITYLDGKRPAAEWVDAWPNQLAAVFARRKLSKHQLRALYGHVKRLEAAWNSRHNFERVYGGLLQLKPYAHARMERGKIPREFKDFIDRNVDHVTEESFPVFVRHFESVAAYCEGRLKEGQ